MIFAVFLASGHAKRFGGDKLLYPVDGVPMAARAFAALPAGMPGAAVTRSQDVAALARARGLGVVMNPDETDDIAVTIRLGMQAVPEDADGVMFLVCDQPRLSRRSVSRLALTALRRPDRVCVLSHAGRGGNPCVFPKSLFGALRALPRNASGKRLLRDDPALAFSVETPDARELEDLDERP